MANPRKFSEKIALHNQKQAEETAKFEQIMREVSDVTAKVLPISTISSEISPIAAKSGVGDDHNSKQTLLRINHQTLGTFRGGSLPNVSGGIHSSSSSSSSVANSSAGATTVAATVTTVPKSRRIKNDLGQPDQLDASPLHNLTLLGGGDDVPVVNAHNRINEQPQQRSSRAMSSGGPMRSRAIERRIDTSPYLSPPPDTSWRRTNSDSALHQSAMQQQGIQSMNTVNTSRWNLNGSSSTTNIPQHYSHHHHHHHHNNNNNHNHQQNNGDYYHNNQLDGNRPRSSCEEPRVPGIHIYPSVQEPGIVQIPIGNNTGSLPDLTSVHFPSPLHIPLDPAEVDHSSSPYSSSPISASPVTLSPTNVPAGHRSPHHYNTHANQFHFNNSNKQQQQNTNHLSVPMSFRFLQHSNNNDKVMTLKNSLTNLVDGGGGECGISYSPTSVELNDYQNSLYQHHNSTSASPTRHQPIPCPGYRSPLPRPSPQSSPGVGSRHSAPSSPAANSPLPEYYMSHAQATLLQQHFEQFSMMDSPVTGNYNMDPSNPTNVQMSPPASQQSDVNNANETTTTTSYYGTSPTTLVYPSTQPHTTPNTPTSIPDIILTDFSTSDVSKELSTVITGTFDTDLFPTDESLRDGLDPIDFDGLQMLSDPDMHVISENAEDHFRLDRL